MALTPKKRKFAAAILEGMNNTEAAIEAGYSKKTAPQAGCKLIKDSDVLAEMERKKKVELAKSNAKDNGKPLTGAALKKCSADPREFLTGVMQDEGEESRLRVEAAKTLMAYKYAKPGELGKKQGALQEANEISGIFAPRSSVPITRQ